MDASTAVSGKRDSTPMEQADIGYTPCGNLEKRPSGEALEMPSAADLEVAKEHAQKKNSELKPLVDANRSSVVEAADRAVPASVAGECNRELGQELPPEEEEQHAELAQAAKTKVLDAW